MDDDFDDGNPYAPPPPDPENEPVETDANIPWSLWKQSQFVLGGFAFFLFVLTLVDVACLLCYVPGVGFAHPMFWLPPVLTLMLCIYNVDNVNWAMTALGIPFWRRQRTLPLVFVPLINLYFVLFRLLPAVSRALEASKPRGGKNINPRF